LPNKQSFRRFWLPKIAFLAYGLYALWALGFGLNFVEKISPLGEQLICRHTPVASCRKTTFFLWHTEIDEIPLRLVRGVESQRYRTASSPESANYEIVFKMGDADFSLEYLSSEEAEARIKVYQHFLKDRSAAPILYHYSQGYELFYLSWLMASLILSLGLLPLIAIFWVLRPKSEPGIDSNPDSNLD
jgi:hypothetical protein